MTWSMLHFTLIYLAIAYGCFWVARSINREETNRNMRYFLPWLLFGFVLTVAVPLISPVLPEETLSSGTILYLLLALGFSLWGLTWPYRKREAGDLLFDAGRTWHSKMLFWIGISESGVAAFVTWLSFGKLSAGFNTADNLLQAPRVIFWWTIAILLISLGLSKLEMRKNGFCFLYMFVPWRQISAYKWEPLQPNVWTVQMRQRLPLWSNSISLRVPKECRAEVDQVANTYIPIQQSDSL